MTSSIAFTNPLWLFSNKSTNLFVSKKRISLRGLPKRDFIERELKELMLVVIDEWIKSN